MGHFPERSGNVKCTVHSYKVSMRIAIYHNLPSGGAKRALYEQTRRLSQHHELDVYTLSCAEHTFCDIRPFVHNYRVFDFRRRSTYPHPFGLLDHGVRTTEIFRLHPVQRAMAKAINRGDYDVILVHSDQITQSPIILQYLQIPSAYYCHDVLRKVYDPPITRPYMKLMGLRYWVNQLNLLRPLYFATIAKEDNNSLTSATLVLVNSYFSSETVYRLYEVSARVCYLGVDIDLFRPLRSKKDDYVLSVGAVTPPKGFDFIIKCLGLIPKRQRPPLVIVGNHVDQNERLFLENLAHLNDVQVEFRSCIQDTALVELYDRARLTLYAPILEPFGLVSLETMACGTPVVGVAEGGVRETIRHGETGLLTDRDPTQFAEAMLTLLIEPSLAAKMGEQGAAYIRHHWRWEDSAARLESYLKTIADGIG